MTQRTTEMMQVMQAFLDGKTIQSAAYGNNFFWATDEDPTWNWGLLSYRIKTEPNIIWVNEYADEKPYAYNNKVDAIEAARHEALRVAVKYQEVLEES